MTATIDRKQVAALILLGIAIGIMLGTAGAYSAITDSIEARAADGVPISIGGKLYDVREVDRGMNLSEARDRCESRKFAMGDTEGRKETKKM